MTLGSDRPTGSREVASRPCWYPLRQWIDLREIVADKTLIHHGDRDAAGRILVTEAAASLDTNPESFEVAGCSLPGIPRAVASADRSATVCGVVLTATEKSLSNRLSAGRGRRRFSTVNCGRSTKFSKMRSRRLRKIRRRDPNASQSTLTIIRFITRVMASRRCYVIDFSAGQSFGEAQV